MRLFPKRYFGWWEPRVHRRFVWQAEMAQLPRSCLRAGLVLSLILGGIGSLARTLNPNPDAPGTPDFLAIVWLAGMGLP